jgi:TPR repeat protein
LPISLPDETISWVKSIFDLVSRLSAFLSSLRPRKLAWAATAAAIAVFIPAAVITAVVIKEQGAPSSQAVATSGIPDVMPRAGLGGKADRLPMQTALAPMASEAAPLTSETPKTEAAPKLNEMETVALVAQGRKLIVEGKIAAARLVLQQAADAGNAAAALELGATYDPMMQPQQTARSDNFTTPVVAKDAFMAKAWYEKARDLGSTEAAERLKGLH